jgi:hypothetical protein
MFSMLAQGEKQNRLIKTAEFDKSLAGTKFFIRATRRNLARHCVFCGFFSRHRDSCVTIDPAQFLCDRYA